MTRRVVITGIGVVAPGAATTETFWNNCMAGVAPVSPIPAHWSSYAAFSSTIWAPLPELDYSAHDISRVERMQLDPSSMLALIAAQQALHNARISPTLVNEKKNTFALSGVDANRCAVFCGTGIGGLTSLIFNQANHIVSPLAGPLAAIENQLVSDAFLSDLIRLLFP
jgi:3-oxoacyl-(acyl-carrier-protein) synthase